MRSKRLAARCALLLGAVLALAAGGIATVASAAPKLSSRFIVERSPDGRQVSVRLDGAEVLSLADGYMLRFRCDPSKEHWFGYGERRIHLGWMPNDFPDVRVDAVDVSAEGDRVTLEVAGTKPQLDDIPFRTRIVAEYQPDGTLRYTFASELDLTASLASTRTAMNGKALQFLDLWIERIFWPARYRSSPELFQDFVFGTGQRRQRAPKLHVFVDTNTDTLRFETLVRTMGEGSEFGIVDATEGGALLRVTRLSTSGSLGICWFTWDAHLLLDLPENPSVISYELTIEDLDVDEARDLRESAEPIAFEQDEDYQLPVFLLEGNNDFSRRVATSEDWVWERSSPRARLDRRTGFDDTSSVTIESKRPQKTAWYARTLWDDPWVQQPIRGRYRISAQVRTRNLEGQARIGFLQYDGPETVLYGNLPAKVAYSRAIRGTSQWQHVTMDVDARSARNILMLELDGTGQAWFDNVRIDPLSDPGPNGPARVAFHAGDHGPKPVRRVELWRLQASRPEVRWPAALVLGWADAWVSTPDMDFEPGVYELVLHARGEGCEQDPPVVLVEGPAQLSQRVAIRAGATDDYRVVFRVEQRTTGKIRITIVNDGLCQEPAGDADKNVYLRALTIAGPEPE